MATTFAALSLLVAAAAAHEGVTACPATVKIGSCWTAEGQQIRLGPPQNLTKEGCCRACQASAADPEFSRCTAFQSNYAGNGFSSANETGGANCFDHSVTCCFLYSGPVKAKVPVHPMQSACDAGIMPLPPAPPWPRTPPAGAKNALYVLVDDLRTQMVPYGHSEMKTPHFSAFANTAVQFQQAHCNSQMCVPTRNSFM